MARYAESLASRVESIARPQTEPRSGNALGEQQGRERELIRRPNVLGLQ